MTIKTEHFKVVPLPFFCFALPCLLCLLVCFVLFVGGKNVNIFFQNFFVPQKIHRFKGFLNVFSGVFFQSLKA
jgi:hypothetical protein